MSTVSALVAALEEWDVRPDEQRCLAVERAAKDVAPGVGLGVSELLDAVAAARRGGAGIGQAVHFVVSTRAVA